MSPEQMIVAFFKAAAEQLRLPAGIAWTPQIGIGLLTVLGLLLIIRGARWARGLATLAFAGLGLLGGHWLAREIGTPPWPTAGVVGLGTGVLGLAFFRFWQAVLLAGCLIAGGLGTYYAAELTPAVRDWVAPTPTDGMISLKPAGSVVGESAQSITGELGGLWSHLQATVPGFTVAFWSIVVSTGLAGLVFGLLLPRASRAVWAATLGTMSLGLGLTGLLEQFSPTTLDWLIANGTWAWGLVGTVWLFAFAYNFITAGPRRARAVAEEPEAAPAPA